MKWLNLIRSRAIGLILAGVVIALVGCAAPTVDSRRHERAAAYAALSPDSRALVDGGKIANGMNADAVYIAWDKPAKVVDSAGPSGRLTTWYYFGTQSRTTYVTGYDAVHPVIRLAHYVRAKAVFQDGLVVNWQVNAPGM